MSISLKLPEKVIILFLDYSDIPIKCTLEVGMADVKVIVGVVESCERIGTARVLRQEFAVFVFFGILCGSHEQQVLQEMGQSLQVFLFGDRTANEGDQLGCKME